MAVAATMNGREVEDTRDRCAARPDEAAVRECGQAAYRQQGCEGRTLPLGQGAGDAKELSLWSFLMSTAHGAGLMVAPVLLSSNSASTSTKTHGHAVEEMGLGRCQSPRPCSPSSCTSGDAAGMGVVAELVYDELGVRILRKSWVNSDYLWAASFVAAGAITLVT